MMKKQLILLAVLATTVMTLAAGIVEQQYVLGSLNFLDVPFRVTTCRVGDRAIIGVELMGDNNRLRINGLALGTTDLQVSGNGESRVYRISIVSNLREQLRSITADLENVPSVEATITGNKITLKGEISNLKEWAIFQRLLPFYKRNVLNLVTFQPKAEVMLQLHRALEKAGYEIVRNDAECGNGQLTIQVSGENILVSGSVYSPDDVKRISEIVNAQSWLTTNAKERDDQRILAQLSLTVVPEMLEIGAVYVGMDNTQVERLGNNLLKNGINVSFGAGYNGGVDRNFGFHRGGGSYSISASLGTVVNLLGENTNTVFRHAGFLAFKSNDTPQFRTLHDGGVLKVRVSGSENGSLDDVEYGFILKIKGGLTGKDRVSLEISVTVSTPVLLENGDYDIKSRTINTSVSCRLDETVAIGGLKELLDSSAGPDGLPYLRHIPIVNWFVSEKQQQYSDKQSLLLISPRLMSRAQPIDIPPAQELRDTDEAAQLKIIEGKRKQRRWYQFWRW